MLMVDEELTNAAAISSRIWRTRTQEHSQSMSAKAAQHHIDAKYFSTLTLSAHGIYLTTSEIAV
jgi:hypothetical protein